MKDHRGEKIKPVVVISGVNLVEAGPLSVFRDAIKSFVENFLDDYDLVLLVYNKSLVNDLINEQVKVIELTYPKKSWLLKVWFEYVHLYFISQKINPFLWLSMHDMSPIVKCKNQAVYCHNPAAFYDLTFREGMIEKSLIFFRFFYSFFYRINIHANKYVIVQQDWLRKIFVKRYKLDNVIVAYPDISMPSNQNQQTAAAIPTFFYPAYPRVFKNLEVLFKAAEILNKWHKDFRTVVTIDGSENKYSKHLREVYGHIEQIKFIGLQPRDKVFEWFNSCSCLVFPSKLETWGLPITEAKSFNKPILVANRAYAKETVGNYDKVCFFNPEDEAKLAALMKSFIEGTIVYDKTNFTQPAEPFTKTWKELFYLLLK